ncbi:receptor-like protein 33 [Camellia sinensis]|uniref:receptor-like protein 33 n=1 Tax=Camellia sinensis TaxID=4442 RepID=UPI001035B06B|nr:receptor-like protein 33 [Camellia sinensis]
MIPSSLSQLKYLEDLNFAGNNLGGKVELDIFLKHRNLLHLDLSANKLTVLTKNSTNATIPKFNILGLVSCNLRKFPNFLQFQDELETFSFSDNKIHGEIPTWFWNKSKETMTARIITNSTTVNPCLSSPCDSLLVLNLSLNNFHGTIPHMMGINLKMIDLSQNHLHGLVPRSLQNCKLLEILVLGNNQMEDTFPSWLGALPMLQVLILRSNKFHGAINVSQAKLNFAKLRIIDLSDNGFSGNLPSEYFENWNAMIMVKTEKFTYMQASQEVPITTVNSRSIILTLHMPPYMYSITMDNKGTHRLYAKIQKAFIAIDLSNNKFGGEIPESLGRLSGLQMLNLSNNNFTGVIPSSLASLIKLESLDLSQNLLSGEIP